MLRLTSWVCVASLLSASVASAQAADAPVSLSVQPQGLSPTYFWVAASATIITASLGGFYALHVRDLYDQAQLQPGVSPLRTSLKRDMQTAEVTADLLLIGSLALAAGTTLLAFHIDWSGASRTPIATAAPPPARRTWW